MCVTRRTTEARSLNRQSSMYLAFMVVTVVLFVVYFLFFMFTAWLLYLMPNSLSLLGSIVSAVV